MSSSPSFRNVTAAAAPLVREKAHVSRVALALEHRVRALQHSPAVHEARAGHVAHEAHHLRLTAALVVGILYSFLRSFAYSYALKFVENYCTRTYSYTVSKRH